MREHVDAITAHIRASLKTAKAGNSWPVTHGFTLLAWVFFIANADNWIARIFAVCLPLLTFSATCQCSFPAKRRALFLSAYHTDIHLPWYGDIMLYAIAIWACFYFYHPNLVYLYGAVGIQDMILRLLARKHPFNANQSFA